MSFCIKDKQGIIFGVFQEEVDRNYALRHFVQYGIPCEEK